MLLYIKNIIIIIVLLAINSSQQLTIASTVIRDGSGFRLPSTDNEYVLLVDESSYFITYDFQDCCTSSSCFPYIFTPDRSSSRPSSFNEQSYYDDVWCGKTLHN